MQFDDPEKYHSSQGNSLFGFVFRADALFDLLDVCKSERSDGSPGWGRGRGKGIMGIWPFVTSRKIDMIGCSLFFFRSKLKKNKMCVFVIAWFHSNQKVS